MFTTDVPYVHNKYKYIYIIYVVYTNRKWSLTFPQCVLLQYVLLFLNLRYIVESLASPSLPLIARLIVVYRTLSQY